MRRMLSLCMVLLWLSAAVLPASGGEAVKGTGTGVLAEVHVESNSPYYHRPDCRWLHFGHPVGRDVAAQAHTACPLCHPDTGDLATAGLLFGSRVDQATQA